LAAKGERTRATILTKAAELATVEGLEGLSIGQLAKATGMSKAGLYAHFGSKEQLQLATIDHAREIYVEEVTKPGLAAPKGVARLQAVCEAFVSYVERRVFPGGCFFWAAASELGTRRGRVRDAVAENQVDWLALLERLAREAQELGELEPEVDARQLAFELNAVMVAANNTFILQGDPEILERGRAAVHDRIDRARAPEPAAA
jgi:AcrR family transcriptional regulator